jgi:hypothetical protein
MAVSEPWGMQGSELPKSSNLILKFNALPPKEGEQENPDNYIHSLPETTYVLPEDPDPIKAVNRMIKTASHDKKEDPKDFGMLPLDLWFREHTQVKAKKKKSVAGRIAGNISNLAGNIFGSNKEAEIVEQPTLEKQETRGDLDRTRTQLEGHAKEEEAPVVSETQALLETNEEEAPVAA